MRHDGGIECWGAPWPAALAHTAWRTPADLGLTASAPPGPLALAGRVVDESQRPVANAEVLRCDDPCGVTDHDAMTLRGTIAALLARPGGYPPRGCVVLVTTDRDGRWRAVVPPSRDTTQDRVQVVVMAPGREVIGWTAAASDLPTASARDIALRPASVLDLEPMCGRTRCAGPIVVEGWGRNRPVDGPHVERLPPTGTGQSIRGTADLRHHDTQQPVQHAEVHASCGTGDRVIYRSAKIGPSGAFELRDVGPPCARVVVV